MRLVFVWLEWVGWLEVNLLFGYRCIQYPTPIQFINELISEKEGHDKQDQCRREADDRPAEL